MCVLCTILASSIFVRRLLWVYQSAWRRAPTNITLDTQMDWLLLPPLRHSWWFHQVYTAVVQSMAAAQFARPQRRNVVGRSHKVLQVSQTLLHGHIVSYGTVEDKLCMHSHGISERRFEFDSLL